jgi:hypothetical protein
MTSSPCVLCGYFATFAVKSSDRKERKGFAKGAKTRDWNSQEVFAAGFTAAPDPSVRVRIASTEMFSKRSMSPLGQRI